MPTGSDWLQAACFEVSVGVPGKVPRNTSRVRLHTRGACVLVDGPLRSLKQDTTVHTELVADLC
jgi:hypothetical protein